MNERRAVAVGAARKEEDKKKTRRRQESGRGIDRQCRPALHDMPSTQQLKGMDTVEAEACTDSLKLMRYAVIMLALLVTRISVHGNPCALDPVLWSGFDLPHLALSQYFIPNLKLW